MVCRVLAGLLLLTTLDVRADDFADRFRAAEAKLGDLSDASQAEAADIVLKLALQDEDRLAKLLPHLDLDARSRANAFLADHGFYLDSKKTKRAADILEALSKPPRVRNPLGVFLALEAPDPERRNLVEEFLALGPTSVVTLNRELGSFEAEPVKVTSPVVEVDKEGNRRFVWAVCKELDGVALEKFAMPDGVVQVGAKASGTFRLQNVGAQPLWFLPESAIARVEVQRVHLDIACLAFVDQTKRATKNESSAQDRMLDLLALMTRVKPNEEFDFASVAIPTKKAGMAIVVTSRVFPSKLCGFDFPLEARFGDFTLSLELRLPSDFPSARVFVMGPYEEAPWSAKGGVEEGRAWIEVTLTDDLNGIGDHKTIPEYCWWIAEGANGAVLGKAKFGVEALSETVWAKRKSVRVEVPTALPEGTSRLWLGFQSPGDTRARVAEAVEVKAK